MGCWGVVDATGWRLFAVGSVGLGAAFYCQETRLGLLLSCRGEKCRISVVNGQRHAVGGHYPDLQFFGRLNQNGARLRTPHFFIKGGNHAHQV